jgi:hypothetical protein
MRCVTSSACASPPRSRNLRFEGGALVKPNYRQQKRQKELSRKSRQAEKLQRRTGKTETAEPSPVGANSAEATVPGGTRPEPT